jgi:adenylate cyclase
MSDAPNPSPPPGPAKKPADTQKRNEKLKKFFLSFVHPMAIGTYLAFIFAYGGLQYYQRKDAGNNSSKIMQIANLIDQKFYDLRLIWRGARAPSPDIAVLAVDDRSLDIVGRWPWPREVLARALENAYKNGAKVIAADVVWSEPTDRPEARLVENIDNASPLPAPIKDRFEKKLNETDNDLLFSQFIARHQNNFVLGNFFNENDQLQNDVAEGVQDTCHDMVLSGTPFFKIHEAQTLPIVPTDKAVEFPPEFVELYKTHNFDILEQNIREGTPPPKDNFEKYILEKRILEEKIKFCDTEFLDPKKDDVAHDLTENWAQIRQVVKSITAPSFDEWVTIYRNSNLINLVPEALHWTLNLPAIANQSKANGYFNAKLDGDGTIRSAQLIGRAGTNYIASIALQAFLAAKNYHVDILVEPSMDDSDTKGIREFRIKNDDDEVQFNVPVTPESYMTINYAGRQHMIPHASIADLLDENKKTITVTTWDYKLKHPRDITTEVPKAEFLKDKILVLGATAIGVFDLRVTPFDENYPGAETHANVIDNLLRRDFFTHNKNEDIAMPFIMLLIGLIISIALSRFGAFYGLLFAILIATSILLIDKYFLFGKGVLVSSVFPFIQVFLTYMALTTYKYFTEERSKKELRGTFSKYVSPSIVEEILKDPKNLELGGRKERITVFFSDVRGFTTISEKLDPRALSDLLNSYLTPMTELVFKNKGTLDKYMGDAVMAFFGAPIHYADHAKYACRCALESLEKLKQLNVEYTRKGLPQIDIGIGLNTGECSVGNMGSQTVRSYTVMGDSVNLASRLEGINKEYGTRIIISEHTFAEVKNDFLCREVDWVRVKGKLQPVKIYELISEGKGAQNVIEMAKYFAEGYQNYHEKRFEQAIQHFEKAAATRSEDKTSQLYIERCQEFLEEPPPDNWDGVYVMKTK